MELPTVKMNGVLSKLDTLVPIINIAAKDTSFRPGDCCENNWSLSHCTTDVFVCNCRLGPCLHVHAVTNFLQ